LSLIDAQKEPLAWACREIEGHVGLREGGEALAAAWELVKARLEAYNEILSVTDQAFSCLVKTLPEGVFAPGRVLRTRLQIGALKQDSDRALEVLRAPLGTRSPT
jgi:hypothetical protein